MKAEKVIDILERIVEEDWHVYTDDAIEALQFAAGRMEKEIPKKPFVLFTENGDQTQAFDVCPNCGSPDIDKECGDYCPKCGQKLDWEEKDG